MGHLVADCYGGSGWVISGETLRPVITDLNAFRADNPKDMLLPAIEKLWFGRAQEAEDMLLEYKETFRVKVLLAECKTYGGKPDVAVEMLESLLPGCAGSSREATARQHLGKAYLALGDYSRAEQEFEKALNLRKAFQQDSNLIASSHQALDYVRKRQFENSVFSADKNQETTYLLQSPANARRLLDSIDELESGAGTEHEPTEN